MGVHSNGQLLSIPSNLILVKILLKVVVPPHPTHPQEIVQNLRTENDPTLYFTDLLQLFSHYICYTHKVLNKLAKLGDAIASDLKLSLTHCTDPPTHRGNCLEMLKYMLCA